jgi:hypothetical protein
MARKGGVAVLLWPVAAKVFVNITASDTRFALPVMKAK